MRAQLGCNASIVLFPELLWKEATLNAAVDGHRLLKLTHFEDAGFDHMASSLVSFIRAAALRPEVTERVRLDIGPVSQ